MNFLWRKHFMQWKIKKKHSCGKFSKEFMVESKNLHLKMSSTGMVWWNFVVIHSQNIIFVAILSFNLFDRKRRYLTGEIIYLFCLNVYFTTKLSISSLESKHFRYSILVLNASSIVFTICAFGYLIEAPTWRIIKKENIYAISLPLKCLGELELNCEGNRIWGF